MDEEGEGPANDRSDFRDVLIASFDLRIKNNLVLEEGAGRRL